MPRTLAQNAQYIAETIKPAIKSAIEAQGVTVPSTDSFLDYADRIGEIEGGGSGYQLKDLPTGSISTVNDAAELPLNALKVSVEAWQEGSGDPSPSNIRPLHGWDSGEITVEGNNQLPMTVDGIKSANSGATWTGNSTVINGVTFTILTDNDGNVTGINANGTASDGATFNIIDNASMSLSGEYRLLSNQYLNDRVCAYTFDFSNHVDIDIKSNQDVIETFNNNILTHMHIYIWVGNTADNWIFTPMMLELKEYTQQFPQTIYGAEWDVVGGELKQTDGYIASYNGESLPSSWISDRDVYDGTNTPTIGAEVVYKLATPTTIDLSPLSIRMLQGVNNLYADCGEVIEGEYFVGETKAYDLVEYIESDGTQVIDTGHQLKSGDAIDILYAPSSNGINYGTSWGFVWAAVTQSNSATGLLLVSNSQKQVYDKDVVISTSNWSNNQIYDAKYTVANDMSANIKLFGKANSGTVKGKLYSFSINGDCFLPCKRRADGVYGLYDIANSQFLTDVASGNPLTGGASLGIRIG